MKSLFNRSLHNSPGQIQTAARWVKPVGDVFTRFLFMTVIPLVVSVLALGVAEIGDVRRIGRMGLRTLLFTVLVSSLAVLIGVGLVQGLRPGESLSPEYRRQLLERFSLPASVALSAKSGRKCRHHTWRGQAVRHVAHRGGCGRRPGCGRRGQPVRGAVNHARTGPSSIVVTLEPNREPCLCPTRFLKKSRCTFYWKN